MMGGLAYMTGPPGRPLRAGASVNDVMGGMFGAIAILAALQERARTGRGQLVRSSLFENNVFLDGAAHDAVRRDRAAGGADAGAPRRLGGLRPLRHGRRRADFRRRRQRHAVARLLRRVRPAGAARRSGPQDQLRSRRPPRRLHAPHPRDFSRARPWRGARQMRGGRAAVSRRWRGRRTCSTTRRSTSPERPSRSRCPTGGRRKRPSFRSIFPANGSGCAATCRERASTARRCWRSSASARTRSESWRPTARSVGRPGRDREAGHGRRPGRRDCRRRCTSGAAPRIAGTTLRVPGGSSWHKGLHSTSKSRGRRVRIVEIRERTVPDRVGHRQRLHRFLAR